MPKSKKRQKLGFFATTGRHKKPIETQFRKRIPCVCYSTPNLALIGKSGSVQEPPKMSKFAQNCGFWPLEADTITDSDEIWPVGVNLGSALAHQIWPSLVKGCRYRSPQNVKICAKLWFLATGSRHSEHIQMKFWPVSVDLESALAYQIWSSSVKGGRYRSPPNINKKASIC